MSKVRAACAGCVPHRAVEPRSTPVAAAAWFALAACTLATLASPAHAQQGTADPTPVTQNPNAGERRFGEAAPKARERGTLRLATYNVFNLFDDRDDPLYSGENEDIDDTTPQAQLEALARTIRELDADVLALQEIENRSVLVEFCAQRLQGMGYEHIVSLDTGDDRGIENAVLSRHPIVEVQAWPNTPLGGVHPAMFDDQPNRFAGQPVTFKRSPLKVRVAVDRDSNGTSDYELVLFVVHHKSGRGADYWREAEARKTLELIRKEQAGNTQANIAVLGDFNGRGDQVPATVYASAGLFDPLADRVPHDPLIQTHESNRRIDFVLLTESLVPEYVPGSVFVLGTPARPRGSDWRTTPPPVGWASDHYPVAIDLVPTDRAPGRDSRGR